LPAKDFTKGWARPGGFKHKQIPHSTAAVASQSEIQNVLVLAPEEFITNL